MSTYPNVSGTMGYKPEQKFRGRWAPQVSNPTPQKFFKTPPPAKPATKKPEPEEPPPPLPPRRLDGPDRPCKMNIRDRMNDYRALITDDGECVNNAGVTIGWISGDEAGTADSVYLGKIRSDLHVENAVGEDIGTLDMGRGYISDAAGNTVCEIQGTGEVRGNGQTYLGQFEPFSYHEMKIIALYVLLIDRGMLSEIEG